MNLWKLRFVFKSSAENSMLDVQDPVLFKYEYFNISFASRLEQESYESLELRKKIFALTIDSKMRSYWKLLNCSLGL